MKKKILAAIAAGLICVSASGCGTTYQEAISANTANGATRSNGYFTEIVKWVMVITQLFMRMIQK